MRSWTNWVGALAMAAAMLATVGCVSDDASVFTNKPVVEEPKIRPGLLLRINVIAGGKTEEYQKEISASGELTLPLTGAMKADGLTLAELQDKLKTAYSQYLQDPNVTAQFIYIDTGKSPWGTVLVMGEVGRPGPANIPPTCDLTVTRALQLAGGATMLADKSAVKITRKMPDGKQRTFKVDLDKIGKQGRVDLDVVLKADDVVYVPEIFW